MIVMKRVILVFLKFPEPGMVKTRLAEGIGEEEASLAYRHLVCRVFEQCRQANPDVIAIAYDPVERETEIQHWLDPWLTAFPGEILWIPQFGDDLGERLRLVSAAVFHREPEAQVAIIGTDCIHLDRKVFEETWEALAGNADAVFGPSEDGGYYLLGIGKPQPLLFDGIPWSSSETLEASMAAGREAGLTVHTLPSRIDVDTVEEWKQVEGEVSQRKCVFFDRDGVVNKSPGAGYVLEASAFEVNPGIAETLQWLKERDWLAIVVTSQKGVGKGLMTKEDLDSIHRKMQRELAEQGAPFDGIYAFTGEEDCPHEPKPDPEMIFSAADSFFIDRRQSWMIGDADRDIEMGKAANLGGTIRVKGENPIGIPADHTVECPAKIFDKLSKLL